MTRRVAMRGREKKDEKVMNEGKESDRMKKKDRKPRAEARTKKGKM